MADTIEKRVQDVEYLLAHLPKKHPRIEMQPAGAVGPHVQIATRHRDIAVAEGRLPTLQSIAWLAEDLDARFAGTDSRMNAGFDQLSIRLQVMERRLQNVEIALASLGAKIDKAADQLAEILQRLPPKP
jgi:hypothetical protein